MSHVGVEVATAAAWLWLGMVLAISFLEAPLKFRAPGLDLRVGLALGRIVFRALNRVEVAWLIVIVVCLVVARPAPIAAALTAAGGALPVLPFVLVRPRLNRRSNQVLAGSDAGTQGRSHAHHVYVALEAAKVVVLIALGCALLAA